MRPKCRGCASGAVIRGKSVSGESHGCSRSEVVAWRVSTLESK